MSILYKNGDGNIVSLIPDMNNIDDTTVSVSTTYSSSKIEQINAEYPIASTTTGINPTITDSADGLIQDVKVYGESRTSKNLFDKTAVTASSALDVNNGTIVSHSGWCVSDYIKVTSSSYTYSINTSSLSSNNITFCYYDETKSYISTTQIKYQSEPITVNTPNNASYIRFEVNMGYVDVAQFELGSEPTPYEPYFSGIHGIGEDGEVDVVTCGKNWLDIGNSFDDWWRFANNGTWFVEPYNTSISPWVTGNVDPETGTIVVSTYDDTGYGWAGREVKLRKNTTYKLNASASAGCWGITGFSSIGDNVAGEAIPISDSQFNTGNYEHIFFVFYPFQFNFVGMGIDLSNETDLTFEPYKSTTAEVTTGLPLYAVGSVKDELDEKRGVVIKRCGVIHTNEWILYLNETDIYYTQLTNVNTPRSNGIKANINIIIPETYTETAWSPLGSVSKTWALSADGKFGVYDTDFSAQNPPDFEVVYELAEPYEIPLTSAELSALRGLKTYSPITNVTVTDAPTSTVGYILNTDNGQAVAELENRIKSEIDEIKNENERSHFCYSYKIDMSDSNPATCVKPHFDPRYGCDNFNFTSAHMDYANDKFDYGSWEGFIRRIARPCMLKYDGTVDYYLDPDDYSKKITGEASDVADVNYQGNAMVELEKLYFKRYIYNGIQYCFIADRKLDKSFKCYAHHDKYDRELDYIYRACYDGMYDGTRLRSISGIDYHNLNALTAGYIMSNATRQEEMDFAKANNVSTEKGEGWNILHKSEWDYINDILVLIGMNTDTQATFGRGRDSGYVSTANTGIISTGTMDTKGLFWGENNGSAGVKVLGFENPWANIWKSCVGWMLISNQHYTKMTFGTEDGSTGTGFNTDGTGYLATGASISANGYISDWAENDNGFLPTAASGSASTYRCDYVWQNTATYFALVGGGSSNGLHCGAFFTSLNNGAGSRGWSLGAALSYKPLSAA